MNEKLKIRLKKLKVQTKKHGPAILGVVGTIVASAVAVYYRNELVKSETIDPDAWPVIEISPGAMRRVEEGATLKYRQIQTGPKSFYVQTTTDDDFPEEANELFAEEASISR